MALYEVFIKLGYSGQDIEAENPQEAARQFVEMVIDNLDVDCVEVIPLEDDEGHE